MKSSNTILRFLAFILILTAFASIANAESVSLFVPDPLQQGQSTVASLILTADEKFPGIIFLTYDNIDSSTTSISFDSSDFSGLGPYTADFSWTLNGDSAGSYAIAVNITNTSLTSVITTAQTGSVLTSMPKVTSSSPTGSTTQEDVIMSVETDEPADCLYDLNDNSYANMENNFTNTGGLTHSVTLNDLAEASHRYYVRCKDSLGFVMNESYVVEFTIDHPPSAKIEISDDSPISSGTHQVTVVTSESLVTAPQLQFAFDDAPNTLHQVSLTGQNTLWEGFMIIDDDDSENRVGRFYFTGTDLEGNVGTEISDGKLFILDTELPTQVGSINVDVLRNGDIQLEWYYNGESVDTFNIYRDTNEGVRYVDFYDSQNGSTDYVDDNANNQVTYYYRIAAVDEAGNVGPLSEEVYATSNVGPLEIAPSVQVDVEEPKVLPPDLVFLVADEEKRIDSLIIDLESITEKLNNEADPLLKDMIQEFGYASKVSEALKQATTIREEISGYRERFFTKQDLVTAITSKERDLKSIEQQTPKSIVLKGKTEFIQSLGDESVDAAVEVGFGNILKDAKRKKEVIKKNRAYNKDIKVEGKAAEVELTFMDNAVNSFVLVEKKIAYETPDSLQDVFVIETIPKTVVESTNDMVFHTPGQQIILEDPVIQWSVFELNYEGTTIKYQINKETNIQNLRDTQTVIVTALNDISADSKSGVTGFSILNILPESMGFSKWQSFLAWFGLFMILGLYLYYQFIVKIDGPSTGRQVVKPSLWQSVTAKIESITKRKNPPLQSQKPPHFAHQNANVHYIQPNQSSASMPQSGAVVTTDDEFRAQAHAAHVAHQLDLISTMIGEANYYLKKSQVKSALGIYQRIQNEYSKLPSDHKQSIFPQCRLLHQKIHALDQK